MIPKIYDGFYNFIGVLPDCIKGIAIEERNGMCEIEIIYPIFSPNWEEFKRGNIIVADTNDTLKNQMFRIYKVSKPISGKINIYARHIFFDLSRDLIEGLELTNASCEYALNELFRKSQFSKDFRGYSDIINAQNYKMTTVNLVKAIGGHEGSILDTYGTGAEILRDNKNVYVLNKRGRDNGVTIEYAKNMTGLNIEFDDSNLVTRIKAIAKYNDKNNNEVIVESNPRFVDSTKINDYETPFIREIDFSSEFEKDNIPTPSELKKLAEKYFKDSKCDEVKTNIKVEFIPLSKCVGYEDIQDKISLCDTVTIRDYRYKLDTQAKVIKTYYDFLANRYEKMELGEPKASLGDLVGGGSNNVGETTENKVPGINDSSFPDTLPQVPTLSSKLYGFDTIELSWTFESKSYYTYELYASKVKDFKPNTFDLLFKGNASTFLHSAKPNETWYYRVRAVNTHGNATGLSKQIAVSTIKINDLSNYVDNAAIGEALIGTLSLDRGWVGQLKGNWIDAKQLSVTDGNGKRTLDIDSFGNVNLDVASLSIASSKLDTDYLNIVNLIPNSGDFRNNTGWFGNPTVKGGKLIINNSATNSTNIPIKENKEYIYASTIENSNNLNTLELLKLYTYKENDRNYVDTAKDTSNKVLSECRLKYNTVGQSFVFDHKNNVYYIVQALLNSNGEKRDLGLNKVDINGNIIGFMYLENFGHGSQIGIDYINDEPRLWIECNAIKGSNNDNYYGTKVCRFKFVDGAKVNSEVGEVFALGEGYKRLSVAVNEKYNLLCIRCLDETSSNNQSYFIVYDLNSVINNSPRIISKIETPVGVEKYFQQGHGINKDTLYVYEGKAATETTPSYSYITVIDFKGNVLSRQNLTTELNMNYRETEGVHIIDNPDTLDLYYNLVGIYDNVKKNNIYKCSLIKRELTNDVVFKQEVIKSDEDNLHAIKITTNKLNGKYSLRCSIKGNQITLVSCMFNAGNLIPKWKPNPNDSSNNYGKDIDYVKKETAQIKVDTNKVVTRVEATENTLFNGYLNNLVINSNWITGNDGWRLSEAKTNYYVRPSVSKKVEDKRYICLNGNGVMKEYFSAYSPKFAVTEGEELTFGAIGYMESGLSKARIFIYFTANEEDINTDYSKIDEYYTISFDYNTYNKQNKTIVVPPGVTRAFLRLSLNKTDINATENCKAFFSSIRVNRGNVVLSWTPNQEDLLNYNNSRFAEIKVTTDGITKEVGKKVGKTEIVSSINQSAETVKIKADKIQLDGATTIGNTDGDKVKINNADYGIYNGNKLKGFLGLRDLDDGYVIPRLALAHEGLDKTKNNYFSINAYPSVFNPEGREGSYLDFMYRCQGYTNPETGYGDISNIKMYNSGDIKVAPIRDFIISTNFRDGKYDGQAERQVAKFGSSASQYYDTHMEVRAIRDVDTKTGLVLGHYTSDLTAACLVRVNIDSTGQRFFRPVTTAGNISLGSANYPFEKVTTTKGVSYSVRDYSSENIPVVYNIDESIDTVIDNINFDMNLTRTKSNSTDDLQLELDISSLKNHPLANMFLNIEESLNEENNTYETVTTADMKSLLHLALYEIQKLKKEIKQLKDN